MKMLKKFIPYYKPYKAVFFFDLFCACVISVIDLAYPQILRRAIKGVFSEGTSAILKILPYLAAALFVMYAVQALCKRYVSYQGHIMGAKMERDMRQELFDHYERLSFSYYDQNNSGQMMSKLISDLFDIAEMAHHGPENLFISLIKIIGSFVFLYLINAELALVLSVIVVLMFLFSLSQNRRMQRTFTENRRKLGDVNASLNDTLSGIRVVQSFANEDIEREKFRKSNLGFLLSKNENYRCMGDFSSGNQFFQGILYLVTLVFGGYLIAKGKMDVADLSTYALYIGVFVSPVQILVELTEMIQKGLSGFRRFIEVTEVDPDIQDLPGAVPLENVRGDVSFKNVSFYYEAKDASSSDVSSATLAASGHSASLAASGPSDASAPNSGTELPVLKGVSFDIPAGRSIALVGPSGSGKTTICNLLPRFYDVTGGEILVDGKNIRGLTLKSLRSSIGIVQQDVYLFDGTVLENISYGKPGASLEEVMAAAKMADIDEFIEELPEGYNTRVGERGARLSGGQKQRIAIARVFLKNPPILILDEATSALDNESEAYIQKSLDLLAKDRTVITVAHRLSTIQNADEILVISEGRVSERGTHTELLASGGTYAKYYEMAQRSR